MIFANLSFHFAEGAPPSQVLGGGRARPPPSPSCAIGKNHHSNILEAGSPLCLA